MLENIIAVVKKLEWQEIDPEPYLSNYICPICYAGKKEGHRDECQMAAAIEEIGAREELQEFLDGLSCSPPSFIIREGEGYLDE